MYTTKEVIDALIKAMNDTKSEDGKDAIFAVGANILGVSKEEVSSIIKDLQ